MNVKIVALVLVVLAVLGGGYFLLYGGKTTYKAPTVKTPVSSSIATAQPEGKNVVTLTANGFEPSTLTIKAGETVTWINKSGQDGAVYSVPHPIHNAYPPLNLGTFSDGATLSLEFDNPGSYGYHNHLNPSQTGTIVVQ